LRERRKEQKVRDNEDGEFKHANLEKKVIKVKKVQEQSMNIGSQESKVIRPKQVPIPSKPNNQTNIFSPGDRQINKDIKIQSQTK
jgi:hypothetical protein